MTSKSIFFRIVVFLSCVVFVSACNPKLVSGLRKNDLNRDVLLATSKGNIVLRLSDSTPLHRDNFIKLVKEKYYDGIIFHRVINSFMIQAGDPESKTATKGQALGNGGPSYTIPAEIRRGLFHQKGVLAAARTGDDVNPLKASSGSQFYIVQGKKFTSAGLDSVEAFRMKGYRFPQEHREVYQGLGGTPHLDQNYTVFGEVVSGLEVVDSIAAVPTAGRSGGDRPLEDIKIISAKLIKRK